MISRQQIKFIRSLKKKKNRILYKSFVVESHKNVLELLDSDYEISEIFATYEWSEDFQSKFNLKIHQCSIEDLSKITNLTSLSDVLAIVKLPDQVSEFNFSSVSIALDNIQDPGNLGTIIRTCHWFGVRNIFCSPNTVDLYNPKVIQSTMGSFSKVNVIYTDLRDLIVEIPNDVDIYAAVLDGNDMDNIKSPKDVLIIFGNESHGISKEIKSIVENTVTINNIGNANSLNVATSSAIILNKFCN